MILSGSKTLIIESGVELGCKQGSIIVKNKEKNDLIPLSEISLMIIDSLRVTITSYLMKELIDNNIRVIFCDEKHNPNAEMVPYNNNYNITKRLHLQMSYSKEDKQRVWTQIVQLKIKNQINLLHKEKLRASKLKMYLDNLIFDDVTNREGMASRVYFNELFGDIFIRGSQDSINSALNYGYSILLSHINRVLNAYGYNTSLGFKHCNEQNPFNLSCDLIEPFRPFVDFIVYNNKEKLFDREYKNILIENMYTVVTYNQKKYELYNAIQIFVIDVMRNVEIQDYMIKEIGFYEK